MAKSIIPVTQMFHTSVYLCTKSQATCWPCGSVINNTSALFQPYTHKPTQVQDANEVKQHPLFMFHHLASEADSTT